MSLILIREDARSTGMSHTAGAFCGVCRVKVEKVEKVHLLYLYYLHFLKKSLSYLNSTD